MDGSPPEGTLFGAGLDNAVVPTTYEDGVGYEAMESCPCKGTASLEEAREHVIFVDEAFGVEVPPTSHCGGMGKKPLTGGVA